MTREFHRDLVPAIALIVVGTYALWEATGMTTFGAVFPTLAGGGLVLGGAALTLRAIFWEPETQRVDGGVLRPLVLLAALLIWALLLPITGFVATSILAALVVMRVTQQTPLPLKSYLMRGTGLCIMVGFVALIFQQLLNVPLP